MMEKVGNLREEKDTLVWKHEKKMDVLHPNLHGSVFESECRRFLEPSGYGINGCQRKYQFVCGKRLLIALVWMIKYGNWGY